MTRNPLDYQTPTSHAQTRAPVYWGAFGIAAIAGVLTAHVIADQISLFVNKNHSDGGATIIATIFGIPLAAAAAGVVREIRWNRRTPWGVAAVCGLVTPPLVVVLLFVLT